MKILQKIYVYCIDAVENNMLFFAALFLLATIPDACLWLTNGHADVVFHLISWNFLAVYMTVLVINLIKNKKARAICQWIIIAAALVAFFVDMVCVMTYGIRINENVISTVLFTNPQEITEFWQWGVSLRTVVASAVALAAIILACYAAKKTMPVARKRIAKACAVLLPVSIAICLPLYYNWYTSFLYKPYLWVTKVAELPPNLADYELHPRIEYTDDTFAGEDSQLKVVLVIGESMSALHVPFCGYEKNTMPRISARLADNELVAFDNVHSPASATFRSFPLFMTEKETEHDDAKWWEQVKITDVFREARYKLYWLSNQSKIVRFDGPQMAFAKVCDTTRFVVDEADASTYLRYGMDVLPYDEQLLPIVESALGNDRGRSLYFINLIGNHLPFDRRIPAGFGQFTAADYADRPEHQRELLATYDNSILYTDSVLDCMISLFDREEALLIYFPDHGLDIYATAPDHAGFGRDNDPASVEVAKEIPLLVYTSEKFAQKHPEVANRIKSVKITGFNTTDMIYMLMDLCGLKFADNDRVAARSPYSAHQ